jgi:hypothetical protein
VVAAVIVVLLERGRLGSLWLGSPSSSTGLVGPPEFALVARQSFLAAARHASSQDSPPGCGYVAVRALAALPQCSNCHSEQQFGLHLHFPPQKLRFCGPNCCSEQQSDVLEHFRARVVHHLGSNCRSEQQFGVLEHFLPQKLRFWGPNRCSEQQLGNVEGCLGLGSHSWGSLRWHLPLCQQQ